MRSQTKSYSVVQLIFSDQVNSGVISGILFSFFDQDADDFFCTTDGNGLPSVADSPRKTFFLDSK